ncbi:hypothetical protein [Acinetobacter nosocomialis]|uniref:hypothetical protein n=1 Tax=Acinetobacter nosocomialis TaxID=106654 RepID=UPI0024DE2997|nr:hypothetical protein [Acinetobacter nosocomialis]
MKINVRFVVLSISLTICIFFLGLMLDFININGQKIITKQLEILANSPLPMGFFIGGIIALAYFAFNYLDKDSNKKNIRYDNENLKESILADIHEDLKKSIVNEVQEELSNKRTLNNEITDEQKQQLIEQLKNKIEQQTTEIYFNQLKDKIKVEIVNDSFENKINKTMNRLENERISLARRGNLNLVLGMTLSFFGLAVLASSIFLSAKEYTDIYQLILNMLPKTTLALFIEIFAYFFLRLYKQSLDDIKFYQNELTNIEAKYLSLQIAKQTNNHKLITTILDELVKTERNFILEKGQSTIEIEKEKISSTSSSNALKTVTDLLKSKN